MPNNAIYDFIPGDRQALAATDPDATIVANAKLQRMPPQARRHPGRRRESSAAGFHGGSRNDTQYCVVCHTDQRKYGQTEATSRRRRRLHVHGSDLRGRRPHDRQLPEPRSTRSTWATLLAKQKLQLRRRAAQRNHVSRRTSATAPSATTARPRSSAKTAQGDNWKNVPSRARVRRLPRRHQLRDRPGRDATTDAAKGLTVDDHGSDWLTSAAAQPDDSQCALCHDADRAIRPCTTSPVTPPNPANALARRPAATPTPTRPGSPRSTARLPAGAIKVDLRHPERLAQREQAAGDGVPDAAERGAQCRSTPSTRRNRQRHAGDAGTTSWVRRARTSCSRCRRTASPRRPTSTPRLPATCAASGTAGQRHRRTGTLTGPDAQRLLHRHADRRRRFPTTR